MPSMTAREALERSLAEVRRIERQFIAREQRWRHGAAIPLKAKIYTNGCRLALNALGNTPFGTVGSPPFAGIDQSMLYTIYLTPCFHNAISLFDGSAWTNHEIRHAGSLATLPVVTISEEGVYDIFAYWNLDGAFGPQVSIEAVRWANKISRSTLLVRPLPGSGILVKSDADSQPEGRRYTRRYLGTVYYDSTFYLCDDMDRRYIWNYENRVAKRLYKKFTGSTSSTSFEEKGRIEAVIGIPTYTGSPGSAVDLTVNGYVSCSGTPRPTFTGKIVNEILEGAGGVMEEPQTQVKQGSASEDTHTTPFSMRYTTLWQGLQQIKMMGKIDGAGGSASATGQFNGLVWC